MNEAFPRCAVPGSSCRLLQLEAPGARPVWAVLDAAGSRHFTGEITLHVEPTVRAWFNGGELYYAERDGDAPLAERLLAMGVVSEDDLAVGSVQLGAVAHLGRLFDRVPDLDRDRVELALDILTGEVVGEIADHVADDITIASYRHHSSGVVKWQKRPTVVISQVATTDDQVVGAEPMISGRAAGTAKQPAPLDPRSAAEAVVDEDAEIVAAFEAEIAASLTAPPDIEAPHDGPVPAAELPDPTPAPLAAPALGSPVLETPVLETPVVETPVLEAPVTEAVTTEAVTTEAVTTVADSSFAPAPDVDAPHAPATGVASDPVDTSGLGGFELSFGDLRAELEAELRAQLGTAGNDATEAHAAMAEPSVHHDEVGPLTPLEQPSPIDATDVVAALGEPSWQIDDRIDWQVDEPSIGQAGTGDLGSSLGSDLAADAAWHGDRTSEGPVVEFDLDDILRQVNAGDPSSHRSDASNVAGGSVEADDDVRAAVRAALQEIEAATRTTGNDEIPSILMQAALADSEPGLAPSVDSWVQASLEQERTPTSDAANMPDESGVTPQLSLRPVLPGVAPTLADDPATGGDAQRPADPPSQEMPSTGGLRRTIGIRKPT